MAMDDRDTPDAPEDDTRANRAASTRDATEGGEPTTMPSASADRLQHKASEGDAQGGAGRPPDDE